jgi:hypothetical protein
MKDVVVLAAKKVVSLVAVRLAAETVVEKAVAMDGRVVADSEMRSVGLWAICAVVELVATLVLFSVGYWVPCWDLRLESE